MTPSHSDIHVRVEDISKLYPIHQSAAHVLGRRVGSLFRQTTPKKNTVHRALENISFELQRGDSRGIVGRNGSGKSTLLQMIAGTLCPSSGSLSTLGRIAAILELGAGFHPDFTGRENAVLQLAILGFSADQAAERMEAVEAFADIGKFFEEPIKTYSSGMLVRLAFGVIAHSEPDILIVDEALAVGDALFVQKCLRFIEAFRKDGILLFVSHSTSAVRTHCDRALWIHSGQAHMMGPSNQVTEAYIEAFFNENNKQVEASIDALSDADSEEQKKPVKLPTTVIPASRNSPRIDMRRAFINGSNLRNDLKVIPFDREEAQSFGNRGARIEDVDLLNEKGQALSHCVGGERVCLRVVVTCYRLLKSPIVGFFVRNSVGLEIFGDNTFLSSQMDGKSPSVQPGQLLSARFDFEMPILPEGNYTMTISIADGDEHTHIQHEWIHDAIAFESLSSSVCTCLVGIPMEKIVLKTGHNIEDVE